MSRERRGPTERQVGWISHNVLHPRMDDLADYEAYTQDGRPFNAPLVGAERWCMRMTFDQASSVITAQRDRDAGFETLVLYGMPTKKKIAV